MQNLILKSLVLIGVIGGSCFVVWKAQTSLNHDSTEADPTEFTALDGANSEQKQDPDDSVGDIFSDLDLSLDGSTPEEGMEPTPAAPWQSEESEKQANSDSSALALIPQSEDVVPSDDTSYQPNQFPAFPDVEGGIHPIADQSELQVVDTQSDENSVTPVNWETENFSPTNSSVVNDETPSLNAEQASELENDQWEVIQLASAEAPAQSEEQVEPAEVEGSSFADRNVPSSGDSESVLPEEEKYEPLTEGEYIAPFSFFNPEADQQPTVTDGDNSSHDLSFEEHGRAIDDADPTQPLLPTHSIAAQPLEVQNSLEIVDDGVSFGPGSRNNDAASEVLPVQADENEFSSNEFEVVEDSTNPGLPSPYFGATPTPTANSPVKESPLSSPNQFEAVEENPPALLPQDLSENSNSAFPALPTPEPLGQPNAPNPFERYQSAPISTNEITPANPADAGFTVSPTNPPLPEVERNPFQTRPPVLQPQTEIEQMSGQGQELTIQNESNQPQFPLGSPDPRPNPVFPSAAQIEPSAPVVPHEFTVGPIDSPTDSVMPPDLNLTQDNQSPPSFEVVDDVVLPDSLPTTTNPNVQEQPFTVGTPQGSITPTAGNDFPVGSETEDILPPGSGDAIEVVGPGSLEPAPLNRPDPELVIDQDIVTPRITIPTDSDLTPQPNVSQGPNNDNALIGQGTVDRTVSSGPQSPELTIEKKAPKTATIGEELIYSIVIKNVGGSSASSLIVQDRIPRGTKLQGTIPQAVLTDGTLTWKRPSLQPGEEWEIQLLVIPIEAGEIGSVATVSFQSVVSAKIEVTAPKIELKMTGPSEAVVGKNIPYQFKIANTGEGNAKDVSLRTILPEGLTHPGGQDIEYRIGDLPAGESRDVELVLQATHSGIPTIQSSVIVNGETHDQTQTDLRVLTSRLKLVKTGPQRGFVGREATFQTEVTNESSQQLNNIVLTETLPIGLDPVGPLNGWDPQTRKLTWTIPLLNQGETKRIEFRCLAKKDGEHMLNLLAQDRSGNQAVVDAPFQVKGFADLDVDITGATRTAVVGEQVSFRLNLRNGGTAAAEAVRASFRIPPGLSFISAKGPSAHQLRGNVLSFEPISQVEIGAKRTYDIVLTAASASNSKLRVALESADYPEPIQLEEPVRVVSAE